MGYYLLLKCLEIHFLLPLYTYTPNICLPVVLLKCFQKDHVIKICLAKEIVNTEIMEPSRGKTQQCGFRPGPTQIRLYNHRSRLEARNFGFKKKRDCTISVAK